MKINISDEVKKLQENDNTEAIYNIVFSRLQKLHNKLYQYCPFDSSKDPFSDDSELKKTNYHFRNVLAQQIYASPPSNFNDPFDCIIGASAQTILSAIIMSLMNVDYLQPKDINKDELKRMVNGDMERDRAMEILQGRTPNLVNDIVIGMLIHSDILDKLKARDHETLDEDENIEIFTQIFNDQEFVQSFIHNMINPKYMNDETLKQIQGVFSLSSAAISQKLIKPAKMDFDEDGNVVDLSLSVQSIEELATIFGKDVSQEAAYLQGSLDVAYMMAKKGLTKFSQTLDESMGITCFSSRPDIPLMWSHYANKHQGFVIEYDLTNLSQSDAQYLSFLFPVKYSKYRPTLDNRIINDISALKDFVNYKDYFLGAIISALFTKSSVWRYEKEWRNLALVNYTNDRKIHFPYISRIILGAKTKEESVPYFERLHQMHPGIQIDRYKLDDDSYRLVLIEDVVSNV